MTLEEILKPIRKIDQKVLHHYTEKAEEWEAKGRSKYSLAQICNLAAFCANVFYLTLLGNYAGLPILTLQSSEFARNIAEYKYKREETDGAVTRMPKHLQAAKTIADYTRLPLFVSGGTLLLKGIFDMMMLAATKENEWLASALENISLGYALLGTSSSMYLKDSDPKLLEKKSFIELVYQKPLKPLPVRNEVRR